MSRALHRFVPDALVPRWCAICGRAEAAHTSAGKCAHCDAELDHAAGLCVKCGQRFAP